MSIEAFVAEMEDPSPLVGTDMVRYDLYVRDDKGKEHEFSVIDDSDPGSILHRLLDLLNVSP